MDFKYLFTSFNGRINRAPYWVGILLLMAASLVVIFAFLAPAGVGALLFLFVLILVISAASVPLTVKRLHDRDKSGHYAWLIYGSSLVGSLVDPWTRVGEMNVPRMIISLITVAIGLWFFIELGFFRGTAGPNAYGADPIEGR